MGDRVIYLPVNATVGEVDYMYVEYDLREPPADGEHDLIEGWEWSPFKIVPANVKFRGAAK